MALRDARTSVEVQRQQPTAKASKARAGMNKPQRKGHRTAAQQRARKENRAATVRAQTGESTVQMQKQVKQLGHQWGRIDQPLSRAQQGRGNETAATQVRECIDQPLHNGHREASKQKSTRARNSTEWAHAGETKRRLKINRKITKTKGNERLEHK